MFDHQDEETGGFGEEDLQDVWSPWASQFLNIDSK